MTSRRDSRGPDYEDDERFAEWVDGCMSERDRDRFEAEMRVNSRLREAAERYRRTVESVRTVLRAEGPKIDVADAVLARIAGRTAAPAAAPDPSPARGATRAPRGSPFRWRALLASVSVAAALVALFVWLDRIEPAVRSDEMAAAPEAARAADEDGEFARLDRPAGEGQWQEDANAAGGREYERSPQPLDLQRPEGRKTEAQKTGAPTTEEKSARVLALEELEQRAERQQAERSTGAAAPTPAGAQPGEQPATDPAAVAGRAPLAESTPGGNEEAKGELPSPGAAAKPRAQAPERASPKVADPGSAVAPEADRSATALPGAGALGGPSTPGAAGPSTPGPAGPATGGALSGAPANDREGQPPPTFGARGSRRGGDASAPEPNRREGESRVGQRDANEVTGETGIASTLPLLTFAPQAGTDKDMGPGQRGQAEDGRPEDGATPPTRSRSGEGAGAAAETKRRSQPELRLLALLEPAAGGSATEPAAAGEASDSPMQSRAQDELRTAPAPRVRRLQADATAIRTIAPGMVAGLPGDAFLIEGDEAQVKAFLGRLAAVAQRERFVMQTAEIPLGLVEALTPALPADAVPGGRAGESRKAGQSGERPAELADDPAPPEAGAATRERAREDARRRDSGAGAEPSAPGKPVAMVRVVVVVRDTPMPRPATEGDQGR